MATSAATERRELAHRMGNGIEVTLLWTEPTNTVTIAVLDEHSGEELEFEVDRCRALDAFNHPYAYAAIVGVRGVGDDATSCGSPTLTDDGASTANSGRRY